MCKKTENDNVVDQGAKRFATFFQTLPLGVVYHLRDGSIESVNDAACEILGLTRDELLSRTSMDPRWKVEAEDGTPLSGKNHPAMIALRTGEPVKDVVISVSNPKFEKRRWLLVNAVPEFEEGQSEAVRSYAAFADITTRREALIALGESEKRFRNVIEASPMGVHLWRLNDEGKLIFEGANKAADRILETDNSQFIGMEITEAFPAHTNSPLVDIYKALCKGAPPWRKEQLDYRDEQIRGAFEVHAFQTAQGRMAAFFQDITQRKKAEDERESLIRMLNAKQEELENFIHAASHDLKSPLITIKGFLGMAERDMAEGKTEDLKRDLERISGATERMFMLLGDLLEYSRLGRTEENREELDVLAVLREVIEVLEGPLKRAGGSISLPESAPVICMERTRLHRLFQNLLENSIKFVRKGAPPEIHVSVATVNGETCFSVCDSGIGIEPRHQKNIFNLFSKLDPMQHGSGMGLAMVKRIVEHNEGEIWLESEGSDKGTCVRFTLPKTALQA